MAADSIQLPLLIEAEQLEPYLGHSNVLIVDLSKPQLYFRCHVPGAVHLPFASLMKGEKPAPGLLPSVEQLTEVFSGLGLTPDTHVIAYDDEGGGWAGRLLWTLELIGHKHYSYLNGGIHAWVKRKMDIQSEEMLASPSTYKVSLDMTDAVDKDYIVENYQRDDLIVWDARSPEEHSGEKMLAARAGHIPGAANYEWTRAMDRMDALRIRDLDVIRKELSDIGITADKEIITHCQTHHRSGFTYLLGRILGFENIKAYPGSWSEWGNDADTPVELSDI
ncbi:thiosulfate sulfurtransferase [Gammaproteobacteria bacterium 45_16_T64]|nr:thiosulfate sulfurtransferase [Gammaproteobacteria bacterium 45_16_T64]